MELANLRKAVPAQWKMQTGRKGDEKGICVAYIDARDCMKILDDVVGPENWQDQYRFDNGKLIAGVGVKVGNEWIWKFDTGSESDMEADKGAFSDAFKRACVKWGIGRFLYDMEIKWVKLNPMGQPVTDHGARIWNLTEHFNGPESIETPKMKEDPRKEEIMALIHELGFEVEDKTMWVDTIKSLTGLIPTLSNYDKIIDALRVKILEGKK